MSDQIYAETPETPKTPDTPETSEVLDALDTPNTVENCSDIPEKGADIPETSNASVKVRRCGNKGIWSVFLLLVLLYGGLTYGGYLLYQGQANMREQMQTLVSGKDLNQQVLSVTDPLSKRIDSLASSQQNALSTLETSAASLRENQQNAAHAVSRFDQAIVRLENEQRSLVARLTRLQETRQAAPAKAQSESEAGQTAEIVSLVTMAQDQLALNLNPVQTRILLSAVAERLAKRSNPKLVYLREAVLHDLELLKPYAVLDRTKVLARLSALEAVYDDALRMYPAMPKRLRQTVPAASSLSTAVSSSPASESVQPGIAESWLSPLKSAWKTATNYLGDYIRIQRHVPRHEPLPQVVDVAQIQLEFRQWLGVTRVALFTHEYDVFKQSVEVVAGLLAKHANFDRPEVQAEYDWLISLRDIPSQFPAATSLRSGAAAQALSKSAINAREIQPAGVAE